MPFLVGRVLSALGRQMLSVAVGWDLYERTGSFVVLGLVGLAQVSPVLLLSVPMGHAVDRLDARRTGALSCLLLSLTGAGFTAAALVTAPLWMMFTLLVAHGVGMAMHAPSVASVLPRLVDKDSRARANALVSTGFELASIGGPAAAGLILGVTRSAAVIYALHAALSLALFVVLAVFQARGVGAPEAGAAGGRSLRDMVAGVRFVFASRLLLPAMTLDLFAVLFGGVTALMPAFAKDILAVGPSGLGALRAAPALGALVTAIISTRIGPWKRPGRVLFFTITVFGVSTLAFALSPWLPLSCACLALAGGADEVSVIIRQTLEQMVTPDAMRGRVSAVRYVFVGMSNQLGELESGLTAALLGAVGAVAAGAVACLAVIGVVAWRWPQLRRLGPLQALTPEDETTAAPPRGSSSR